MKKAKFQKKLMAAAVVSGLAAGAANAVYMNQNGTGEVLLYPYYTVQGGHNTYISVVNTTTDVKVVKVRFREGRASFEVLDFNLYLSPRDVWTAAVVPSPTSDAAMIVTNDTSCTNPQIPTGGVEFRNFLYDGSGTGGDGLDRTREGYVEMLEIGRIDPDLDDDGVPTNPLWYAAVHCQVTLRPSCTGLRGVGINLNLDSPSGGLMGTGTLINVTNGQDSGYNAVALDDVFSDALPTEIANDTPNFFNADEFSTVVSGRAAYSARWIDGVDAVSSVMMHSRVLNEYVLDTVTNSNTDWVLTFPTAHYYRGNDFAIAPFTRFTSPAGACEQYNIRFLNREESSFIPVLSDFSPRPQAGGLCWESTVVSIRNGAAHMPTGATSGVLRSVNTTAITIPATFQNGWANLQFYDTQSNPDTGNGLGALEGYGFEIDSQGENATSFGNSLTFHGLPVIGFMVRTFNNGTLGNFQANYGSAFGHKYQQSICAFCD